jgi:hypothetical protein
MLLCFVNFYYSTDLLSFVGSVVDGGGRRAGWLTFDVFVIILPVFIWLGQVAVPSVGCRPVELIVEFDGWRVVRTLKKVNNPHLPIFLFKSFLLRFVFRFDLNKRVFKIMLPGLRVCSRVWH